MKIKFPKKCIRCGKNEELKFIPSDNFFEPIAYHTKCFKDFIKEIEKLKLVFKNKI